MDIKALRLRLGWTQSDLARRLNCQSTEIEIWETGQNLPEQNVVNQLEVIFRQAEVCSDEIHKTPMIENLCESKDLGQIGFFEIKE